MNFFESGSFVEESRLAFFFSLEANMMYSIFNVALNVCQCCKFLVRSVELTLSSHLYR